MIEIKIEQFVGYGVEEFLAYLEVEESRQVLIQLPKRTVLYRSTHQELMMEYAGLALIGQKLNAAGRLFHGDPAGNETYGFVFKLEVTCAAKLAEVLAYLTGIYSAPWGYDEDFAEESIAFMAQCAPEDAVCPDYLELALEFFMKFWKATGGD